jgi:hypothetical protein
MYSRSASLSHSGNIRDVYYQGIQYLHLYYCEQFL